METRFQTSFIPQKPIVTGGGEIVRRKGPPNFFLILGIVVFIFALGLFGGFYLYKGTLVKSNEAKKQQITEAIKNFEPELTKQLTVLKARVDSSKQLLRGHIAATSLLALLESITAQTVRFKEMSFTASADVIARDQKMSLALKGEAQSYASVAFQSDVFSKNENLKNTIFSDLNLSEKGLVEFSVKADIDPKAVIYKP